MSKFIFVIGSLKPFRMLNPLLLPQYLEKKDTSTTQNTKRDEHVYINSFYDLPLIQDKQLRITD